MGISVEINRTPALPRLSVTPKIAQDPRLRSVRRLVRGAWRGRASVPGLGFPIPTRFEGGWFLSRPDDIGLQMFFNAGYEQGERMLVRALLARGSCSTFYDVGANQGVFTLIASRFVPSGNVVAFEPVAGTAAMLERNLRFNGYRGTVIERLALGSAEGLSTFFECPGGDGSVYSGLRPPASDVPFEPVEVQIPVVTLDSYVDNSGIVPEFLKIDVEGGELDVLKGGVRLLEESPPLLLAEISDLRTRRWGYEARRIVEFLVEREYRCFDVTGSGDLTEHQERGYYGWLNILAVPYAKLHLVS